MAIENSTADSLVAFIRRIVREEIAKAQMNSGDDIETFRHCKVVQVYNKTITGEDNELTIVSTTSADVQDLGMGELLENISNKSGEILDVGDTVRVYETRGNYNKRYIGLKCD